ncbi:glycerol-3-phosphate dehydrogenase subunit GlpB [Halovivax sp.]|uniref:glycerol-3-phosphate dehydrogenase subunit GlpB n=1 Tax=Halovivax sp. TaxID=1935978 RepID=UPI0025BF119E|nr:glycerol-3-phosphate dehydrogenase subunit GlpB [Halovivax sp.]
MAIEDDVLVIGGGLAGATAALAAAERGVAVRLVSFKQSTLRHASGLIDVLGYGPDGGGPLAEPYDAIPDLPTGHPYERVGADAVREALSFFDALAGDAYRGDHTETNALVPTSGGTVKPTARYPAGAAAGVATDERPALLVGFDALPEFDAPLAAEHLRAAGVPFDVRGVTLSFPGEFRDDAKITRYAHALDRDEPISTNAGGRPARAALADAVSAHHRGEARIGVPAVLGDEFHEAVRTDLADRLGAAVFEVPTGPPSLPGLRLEDLLFDALESAGVRVTTGVPVVDHEVADGSGIARTGGAAEAGESVDRIDRVLVDRGHRTVPYRASEYVLATGGLVGKGVRSAREEIFEPIFDCHVRAPADRYDWSEPAAFGDHAFARFGVAVDRDLRPLGGDGEPEFANLRAAGAVCGGYDYAAEKSGAGVSLATGYVAGGRAGEVASG